MSIIYKVIAGDTFETISRKRYGTNQESSLISKANPGVLEPIEPGIDLIIPDKQDTPKNTQHQAAADNPDEVAILIDGSRFRFWTDVNISKVIDSIDVIKFSTPFDVNIPGFKEVFKPFSYRQIIVTVGGTPVFTGTIISIDPVVGNTSKTISVSGYSLPGVLNDCTPPASSFPLEFNNQGLNEIANTLSSPFGINVVFKNEQGATFDRVALNPDKKILSFLIELLKQRNLIISNDDDGQLVFKKSITSGKPVAILTQGSTPVLSITPSFKPQQYYSHITGIEPVATGLEGSQYTVKNPNLNNVVRPYTFIIPDATGGDVKATCDAKAGRMFGGIVSYAVHVNTWRDSSGNMWKPNTLINLQAPDAMIYNAYKFLIKAVSFNKDRSSKTATLTLVIPESFNGTMPKVLPWDE